MKCVDKNLRKLLQFMCGSKRKTFVHNLVVYNLDWIRKFWGNLSPQILSRYRLLKGVNKVGLKKPWTSLWNI